MLKFPDPLALTRISSKKPQSYHLPRFDFMQKMGAYTATVFISTLPVISRLMHSSGNHIQLTLTVFFVGSIVGELLAGPLSKIMGCKQVFFLGAIFYLLSALVIRYSSVPSLLLAARLVQAIGAMASIAVTLYSFYTAAPVLPIKAIANPAGGFRHLFMVLTAGIVMGGLSSRLGHAAFLIWSLPTAIASFFTPAVKHLAYLLRATTFGARSLLAQNMLQDDQPLFQPAETKVANIYARQEFKNVALKTSRWHQSTD